MTTKTPDREPRRRRGHGEGSITERSDGRWMGRVDLGYHKGKRRRKTYYGRTRAAVQNKILKAVGDVKNGMPLPDERQTTEQFLRAWLQQKQGQLRPRAFATYLNAVDRHLAPGLGKVPIARLAPQHVQAWFTRHQQEDGASAHAIRYARTVLRAALNQAVRWNLMARNAAALVDPPRHVPRHIQPLTPEQARGLLAAVEDHRLGALISVATALGLRIGEALGLRWQDVDFTAKTLSVRQAIDRSGGDRSARRRLSVERRVLLKALATSPKRSAERRGLEDKLEELRKAWREVRTTVTFVEPKSERSRRTVRMPQVVIAALQAHRKRQLVDRLAAGATWTDSGLVFTTPIGTPLDAHNARREFRAMLTTAEIPAIRFHDLRHTAATLLLAQGVDPRTIMETLGHSQISLTMNTYSHVLPALQEAAAAKMDAILRG